MVLVIPPTPGPEGPEGPIGPAGDIGPEGPKGDQGIPGNTGSQGPQGPAGATGPQGDPGPTGAAGAQGPQGIPGATGSTGSAGAIGPKGDQGIQGPIGATGPQGGTGTQGPIGQTGNTGPEGPQGNPGPRGLTGLEGPQGPIGNTGPIGPQGATGPGLPTGGLVGQIIKKSGPSDFQTQWSDQEVGFITKEPTGFLNRTSSTLTFNDATRTLTIAPVSGSFDIYQHGVRYTKSAPDTLVIPDIEGIYYCVYNNGSIQARTLFEKALFTDFVFVTIIYWDATNKKAIFFGDKRHGLTMDGDTNYSMHVTTGSRIFEGFSPVNYIIDGAGDSNAHAQLSIDDGTLINSDIEYVIKHANPAVNPYEQILDPFSFIPVYYRSGTNNIWRRDDATPFPVKQGTQRIQYNLNTSGNWSTVDVTNGQYINMWIIATFNMKEPIIAILAQTQYGALATSQDESSQTINITGLPLLNGRLICRITYQTSNSYSNTPHARIRSVVDLRSIAISGSVSGPSGPPGPGLIGGAIGQILYKKTATDGDILWSDLPAQARPSVIPGVKRKLFVNHEDFMGYRDGTTAAGIWGPVNTVSAVVQRSALGPMEGPALGVLRLETSAASGYACYNTTESTLSVPFYHSATAGNPYIPRLTVGQKIVIEWRARLYLFPFNGNAAPWMGYLNSRVNVLDDTSTSSPTYIFSMNDGGVTADAWYVRKKNQGAASSTRSGIAAAGDTNYHKFRIEMNVATITPNVTVNALAYYDDSLIDSSVLNLGTAAIVAGPSFGIQQKATFISNLSFAIDYIYFEYSEP